MATYFYHVTLEIATTEEVVVPELDKRVEAILATEGACDLLAEALRVTGVPIDDSLDRDPVRLTIMRGITKVS